MQDFSEFLKIFNTYKLKGVARNLINSYYDEKDNIEYVRNETTAEHVYSVLKLADFFLTNEPEFKDLDRLHCYELLMYHDDIEIIAQDVSILDTEGRKTKEVEELNSIPILAKLYPKNISEKFINLDLEYRERKTPEAIFVKSIDKLDGINQAVIGISNWLKSGISQEVWENMYRPVFSYSPTFMYYFTELSKYLKENKYF
jgi:putative hydrolases of HD superfamily